MVVMIFIHTVVPTVSKIRCHTLKYDLIFCALEPMIDLRSLELSPAKVL